MKRTIMPFKSRCLSCVAFAAVMFFSSQSFAQKAGGSTFSPSGPWNVGATEFSNIRGLGDVKMPCVLSNEFDNGFIVRFSGGGQKMIAMAIDFRQDVFVRGRKYPTVLGIGDAYVKQLDASAFTTSTLIFNLRSLTDFYAMLQSQTSMELGIDGNNFKFGLSGLNNQINDLESCYQGKKTKIIEPLITAKSVDEDAVPRLPTDDIKIQELPDSFDDIVKESDATLPQQNYTPQPILARTSLRDTWAAREGEDMSIVLSRWAEQAGYDFEWQAQEKAQIVRDVNIVGSFDDAVSQIMAESGAISSIQANIDDTQMLSPNPPELLRVFDAQKGSSLKNTLATWVENEGAELRWDLPSDVTIKSNVTGQSSFEQAVQTVLDQYQDEIVRPYGKLEISSDGNKRVLTINNGQ